VSEPHPVIGVLRAGALLGFGWVIAAGLAWQAFGVPWAVLLLLVWLVLQRVLHKAIQRVGEAIRAEAAARAAKEETSC